MGCDGEYEDNNEVSMYSLAGLFDEYMLYRYSTDRLSAARM